MRRHLAALTAVAGLAVPSAARFTHTQLPSGSGFGIPEDAEYDYVVVGGGTAGNVVATRLAQDGRYSVAVVEAGNFYEFDNGNRSVIPGYDFYSTDLDGQGVNPLIDWQIRTTVQPQLGGRSIVYARGKCLGGTSARNYLVYQRPSKGTLKKWAEETGDESWEWENVLEFYRRSATLTPPDMKIRRANSTPEYEEKLFGGGPLRVGYANYASPMASWALKAFESGGSVRNTDGFAGGELLGCGWMQTTIDGKTQERSTSASYLWEALENTHLVIYTRSMAKRLLFEGKTVKGVEVDTQGKKWTLSARKEVIVSAGAFQSPQLLMVSGIGPKKTLDKFRIPIVKQLEGVGKNMWDHPIFGTSFPVKPETGSVYLNNPARFVEAMQMYNNKREGYFTSSQTDVINFERVAGNVNGHYNISDAAKEALSWFPSDWPEVQYVQFAMWFGPRLGSMPPDQKNYNSLAIGLIAPLSRGEVSIQSADMADSPIVNPGWLTHPVDQELVVASIKRGRQILSHQDFGPARDGPETWPGADIESDETILSAIKGQSVTFYHAAATCKMGKKDDPMAVIDSKARVFGVQGLRVVDLSGVPFLPPGQPQATVYMLAEKAAHEILKSASGQQEQQPIRDEL